MTDDASAARWDGRYDRDDYLFGEAPAAFVERQAHRLMPGDRVLAVADGEGRNSVWLAGQGFRVTAFDASARGLEKARALAASKGANVDFHLAGVEAWDWAATPYDAVAAIYIQFAGPALRDRIFAGLDTALRPGGLLLLHGFAPRQVGYGTGGPPCAENMYTLELLRTAFPGYDILHQADYDAVVEAGPGHNGLAAMIDFVARKPA
ncbi:MAG: class I SAM-dependent methyltransferase [Rhodobacter sp.]|nr:class I SAM-dependent methyltransferase [Rhodobacter sp.]